MTVPPGIVDIHVHIQPPHLLHPTARVVLEKGRDEDKAMILGFLQDPSALVRWMDGQGLARIGIINYPAPDVMGFDHTVNEFVTRYRDAHPGRLLAFGGIHPKLCTSPDGDAEIRHALEVLRLDGVKVHPPHQLLPANDHVHGNLVLARLYERCQERGVPVMIHTGTSIFPGARGKFGDPMDADDVAVDFPELRIILAHCGRPLWSETSFHLLRRHPHVYGDISGIPPLKLLEYFPRAAEVADKLLFGTDWPSPGIRSIAANVAAFRSLPLPEAAKEAILWRNADKLFPPR